MEESVKPQNDDYMTENDEHENIEKLNKDGIKQLITFAENLISSGKKSGRKGSKNHSLKNSDKKLSRKIQQAEMDESYLKNEIENLDNEIEMIK